MKQEKGERIYWRKFSASGGEGRGHVKPEQPAAHSDNQVLRNSFVQGVPGGQRVGLDGHSPQPSRHQDGHAVTHGLSLCHVMSGQEGALLHVSEGGLHRLLK